MITFKQKEYSEYEATRALWNELQKNNYTRDKIKIISKSELIPILKGANVVIEKFVVSTSMFGKDKFRMYLKVGAKAKMPDEVRLTSMYFDKTLFNASLNTNNAITLPKPWENNFSESVEKSFADKKKNNTPPWLKSEGYFDKAEIKLRVKKLLGEAILYDKSSRQVVLEFDEIRDAIEALNILPFGLKYNIYILDT